MDKETIDGRKTKIQQPKKTNQFIADSGNLATHGRDSRGTEYQSQRVSGKVDAGMGRTAIYRIIGGILGLLREVTSEALDYMNAHSERLEKRLTESQTAKARFLSKAASLEKEIARLLEQAEKLPEDPNEEEK